MQPLPGTIGYQNRFNRDGTVFSATPYTAAEVKTALHTHRTELFRYELHRLGGGGWGVVADITQSMESCTIKYDGHGEHFMASADMQIVDTGNIINWQTDAVRVFHMLLMPDGHYVQWMKGTFYVPSPEQELKMGAIRKVQAQDALRILYETKITDWLKIPSAIPGFPSAPPGSPLDWVRHLILVQFPFAGVDVTPDTTILVGDDPPPAPQRNRSKIYEVGTSYLDVVNSLLLFCNYEILRADPTGSFISHPFVKPSLRPLEYNYIADGSSIMVRESGVTAQDLWNAPNQWLRVVTRPDAPLLRSRLTLMDPLNPLSTTFRGRTVTDYAQIDAPDQATLDTVVQALYEDGQRILKSLKMETPLMPNDHHDKVMIQWTGSHPWAAVSNGIYTIYGWTFPCVPGGKMELSLELVPFSPAVPVPPPGQSYIYGGFGYYVNGVLVTTATAASIGDSGLGTETVVVTSTNKVTGDSGTGTETVAVTAQVTATDAGVGTHLGAVPGFNFTTDSGAGSESTLMDGWVLEDAVQSLLDNTTVIK